MQVWAKVDDREVQTALRRLAAFRGKPLETVMRQSARRIAVNLAYQTQPFGSSEAAKKIGEAAVGRDIRRVFLTPTSAFEAVQTKGGDDLASGFYAAVKARNRQEAERILRTVGIDVNIVASPSKATHRQARNSRGRVPHGTRHREMTWDNVRLENYTGQIQKRVGFAASGWSMAARDLGGTRGIPNWKKGTKIRKYNKPGRATVTQLPGGAQIVLQNDVPWISQVCKKSQQQAAIRHEQKTLQSELNRAIQSSTRRAGLRAT